MIGTRCIDLEARRATGNAAYSDAADHAALARLGADKSAAFGRVIIRESASALCRESRRSLRRCSGRWWSGFETEKRFQPSRVKLQRGAWT
jgi:hypothetical protein